MKNTNYILSLFFAIFSLLDLNAQSTEKIITNIIEGSDNVLSIYVTEEKQVLIKNEINSKGNSINIHYGVPQNFVDQILEDLEKATKSNKELISSKKKIEDYLNTKIREFKELEKEFSLLKSSQPKEIISKIEMLIENGLLNDATVEIQNIKRKVKNDLSLVFLVEARLQLINGDIIEAGDSFYEAVKLSKNKDTCLKYADYLKRTTRNEEAIYYYSFAIEFPMDKREKAEVELNMGECFFFIGDNELDQSNCGFNFIMEYASSMGVNAREFLLINNSNKVDFFFPFIFNSEFTNRIKSPKETIKKEVIDNSKSKAVNHILSASNYYLDESDTLNIIRCFKALGYIYMMDYDDYEMSQQYFENNLAYFPKAEKYEQDRIDALGQYVSASKCWVRYVIEPDLEKFDSLQYLISLEERMKRILSFNEEYKELYKKYTSDVSKIDITKFYAFTTGLQGSRWLDKTYSIVVYYKDIASGHSMYKEGEKLSSIDEKDGAIICYLNALKFYGNKVQDTINSDNVNVFLNTIEIYKKLSFLEKENEKKIYYCIKRISLIESILEHNSFEPDVVRKLKNNAASTCGNLSWYYLLSEQFKESEEQATKAISLNPNAEWVFTNLALSKLLNNKFDEAKKIYLSMQTKNYQNDESKTYGDIFLEDIAEMEKNGIFHKDFGRIKEELKQ